MLFSLDEILRATGGALLGAPPEAVSAVSTDSRSVKPGELFVALRGPRFDGHDFIGEVARKGVQLTVADASWLGAHEIPPGIAVISVPDTLHALGDLAAFHRSRFSIPLVGVTGSNGKTTTKEMLAAILARTGKGLKTSGNLNNLIGLPQMLLQLTEKDRWAVLEMGMSEPGEIDRLAEIAAPQVGIVTNAFPAHLESMGSVEAVAQAKGELFLRLPAGGTAVCNADDPLVCGLTIADGVTRLAYGLHGAQVTASGLENAGHAGQRFILQIAGAEFPVNLRAFGRHNVLNALAAAAAAFSLGIDASEIRCGLESFEPVEKRFRLEELGDVTLVDDSYNANPGSMAAALVTLSDIRGSGRALAVLGDMLELGAGAMEAHHEVGRLAATCVCRLYLLGRFAETVKAGALEGGLPDENIVVAEDHEQILADLRGSLQAGDTILVKGSRGSRMEKVSEGLRAWQSVVAGKGGI